MRRYVSTPNHKQHGYLMGMFLAHPESSIRNSMAFSRSLSSAAPSRGLRPCERSRLCPWEGIPGAVEYLPKGIELNNRPHYLDSITGELTARPRAVLGFLTPREVFTKLLNEDVAKTA
ncbi:hypothetical protein ABIB48_003503 [Arthrobacter sp. UYCu511]